jgi:hypothetical protein
LADGILFAKSGKNKTNPALKRRQSIMKEASKGGSRSSTPSATRPLLLGLLILAMVAAIIVPLYIVRTTMNSQLAGSPTNVGTQAQSAAVTPGSLAKFVCQITSTAANNRMDGLILKENSDGSYSSTGSSVSIQWDPNRSISMGSRQDVHQGAILQVSGSVGADSIVHADQIVILTGIVTVR